MKTSFSFSSYALGVLTGGAIALIFSWSTGVIFTNTKGDSAPESVQTARSRNVVMLQRQAETLGMTTEELQKELDAGKTFRDIAKEKGVEVKSFPRGGGQLEGNMNGESAPPPIPSAENAEIPVSSTEIPDASSGQ
ncbi:hypothetical protein IPN35_04690 [Candidatus Peregrinibacteria bacterium]|nr:MAG: hypothetical protein IPN35_04690 [Candidatus Peregrinibacteria bacterium]